MYEASGYSWEIVNRKLQFTVSRLHFQVARVSNFSKEFDLQVFDAAILFFRQVEVHHFYRPKKQNKNNSLIQVQNSN